jgi:hypothetical protein
MCYWIGVLETQRAWQRTSLDQEEQICMFWEEVRELEKHED